MESGNFSFKIQFQISPKETSLNFLPNYQRHIGAFIGPYYRLDHINIGAYQLIIGPNIHWTILWTI